MIKVSVKKVAIHHLKFQKMVKSADSSERMILELYYGRISIRTLGSIELQSNLDMYIAFWFSF